METESDILLFVDWLGLSLRLPVGPCDVPGHVWREYSATNVWGKRRILYSDEGDKVCTLLSEPRSNGFLRKDAALLEIENEWLYHGGGVNSILDKFKKKFFFEVLGVSRMDICADFSPTNRQKDIIEGLSEKRYYVASKQNRTEFCSVNHNERLNNMWLGYSIPHQQSWGHKVSDVKWKLYYKSRELLEQGGGKFMEKPYIVDYWRMHGLDVSNVWRLEVSIHNCNGKKYNGRTLGLDTLLEERDMLFESMYTNLFKIRKNQHHKDKSNDEQIEFLDIARCRLRVTKTEPKKMAEHNGRLSLLRALVKSLDDEQVLLDEPTRSGVLEHIAQVIRRDGLHNYFYAMTGLWFEEFKDDCEVRASQKWAVRDAAVAHNENKGSLVPTRRKYDIPKPHTYDNMPVNVEFDSNVDTERQREYEEFERSKWQRPSSNERPRWEVEGLFHGSSLP